MESPRPCSWSAVNGRAATVPLVVMIGINAFLPGADFATYSDYLAAVFMIVGIFVATTAPEMLCVDRREGTLVLYFSRVIGRGDYVLAKIVAMTLLTMTLSMRRSVRLIRTTSLCIQTSPPASTTRSFIAFHIIPGPSRG